MNQSAPKDLQSGKAAAAKGQEVKRDFELPHVRDLADFSTIGLFALASLLALRTAAGLLVPMIAAVVAGIILARVGDRAQKIGVPPSIATIGLVAIAGVGLFFIGESLSSPLRAFIDRLPELAGKVASGVNRVLPLNMQLPFHVGQSMPAGAAAGAPGPSFDISWVTGFFSGLTPALGEILIFLATLFFFVAGRAELRKRVVLASDDRDRRLAALRIINATEGALAHYFGTAAVAYACVGALTSLIAWASGLTTPVLWGVFVFVACFIPFLGPALTTIALISAGSMVHDSMLAALLPAAGFLIAHLICDNAVLPSLVGRRFQINPFLVFVSIVFWTWMWGAPGAVLAAPLLLVARTIYTELFES